MAMAVPLESSPLLSKNYLSKSVIALYPEYDIQDKRTGDALRKGSLLSCYFNLATATVGAGILSLPFAFHAAGLIVTCMFIIAFAFANLYTVYILVRCTELRTNSVTQPSLSFEELVRGILGVRAYYITVVVILFAVLGALIGFLIIIGDLGEPVLQRWVHLDAKYRFFQTRGFLVLAFSVVVIFPLSLFRNFHSLVFGSVLAVISILAVAIAIVYRGAERVTSDDDVASGVRIAHWSLQTMIAVPLCLFALGCHLQAVPAYSELAAPRRARFMVAAACSTASAALLYVVVGVFGYLQFGADVSGDVLNNYTLGDTVVDAVKLVMGFHITLAYPVVLFPGRKCLDNLWDRCCRRKPPRRNFSVRGSDMEEGEKPKEVPLWRVALQNAVIIALTGVMSVLAPGVQVVFGLAGATTTVFICFLMPAIMLWRVASYMVLPPVATTERRRRTDRISAIVLVVFSGVVLVLGTALTVLEDFY